MTCNKKYVRIGGLGQNKAAIMKITEAFDRYKRDVVYFLNQSKKTAENSDLVKKSLVRYLGDIDISCLTFEKIRSWKESLERTRCPATVRIYIIKLRVVLRYMQTIGQEVIDYNQVGVPKREDHIPPFVSELEVQQLIEACYDPNVRTNNKHRNAAIISLLYGSGIRVGELISLNRADLHNASFTVIGKGRKARLCFYDHRTDKLIKRYLSTRNDTNPALFVTNGARMTAGGVQEVFRNTAKRANFTKPITPHTMRHSFSTNFLRNNGNLRYLQELLGHSSLETTQMYTHVVNEDLRKMYAKHHTI